MQLLTLLPPQFECVVIGRSGYKLVVWETERHQTQTKANVTNNITTTPHVHMSMY